MESMQTDLDKLRPRLEKYIQQGEMIKHLTDNDDWKFYVAWLEETKKNFIVKLVDGSLNDQRREDFNRGVIKAFEMFIETPNKFITAGESAEAKLKRMEEAEDGRTAEE